MTCSSTSKHEQCIQAIRHDSVKYFVIIIISEVKINWNGRKIYTNLIKIQHKLVHQKTF